MGAIGVSEYEGVTSPAYDILRPNDGVNPHFYSYLLRNTIIHTELKKYSRGIMEMRLRLYFDELGKVKLPFPPLDVQNKIVRFLNEKLFDIDRYVSSKQKQIDLLNEQKSAFINQVVTKGLDSNVKMKDSGIEWIGEIPSNWIVKPLKYYVHMNIETLPESTDPDYEFEYLDIGNVQTGKIVGDIEKHKFQNAPSRARRIVENGNTIISTVRTYLKAVLYIKNEFSKYIVSTGFAVLKPKKEVIPYFLYLAVQNHPFINMVTAKSVGASYPAINPTTLGSLKLVVPKDVDEQNKIVEFISAQIKKIDQNINSIENQIKLISEYKHSLIAEAVTGKLKIT
jgi:type I restriction enzyme S subunit